MKRVFDFILALTGLLALALPLMVLIWIVRRKLGSPVFFTQVRPGMHGKPFKMVKFRTMTNERGPDGKLLPDAVRLTHWRTISHDSEECRQAGRAHRRLPAMWWRERVRAEQPLPPLLQRTLQGDRFRRLGE